MCPCPGAEHMVSCPLYEPPLTQGEIRRVRRLLQLKPLIGFELPRETGSDG